LKNSLAADRKQTTKDSKIVSMKRLLRPEISRQQAFLRAHIFFYTTPSRKSIDRRI